MNNITVTGIINKKGEHGFFNINQLNDFFKKNHGKNTIITFQAVERRGLKGLLIYFHTEIVPLWVKGFKENGTYMSEQEVKDYLKSDCIITKYRSLSELSYKEMLQFHDYLKKKTLEELNEFIEEGRVL